MIHMPLARPASTTGRETLALEYWGTPYFVSLPPRLHADTPVLVSVHGISRNARFHAESFGGVPEARDALILAPLFEEEAFPRYQRIAQPGRPGRADLALEAILDAVTDGFGVKSGGFFLSGYSGGAQFAHRYAFCRPERVRALGLAAAGWYTFPDETVAYPRGLRRMGVGGLSGHVRAALRIPTLVAVGELDIEQDPALRRTDSIDSQQGTTRLERAERWVRAMRERARTTDLPVKIEMTILPRTGHSFEMAMDPSAGGYGHRFLSFVERSA